MSCGSKEILKKLDKVGSLVYSNLARTHARMLEKGGFDSIEVMLSDVSYRTSNHLNDKIRISPGVRNAADIISASPRVRKKTIRRNVIQILRDMENELYDTELPEVRNEIVETGIKKVSKLLELSDDDSKKLLISLNGSDKENPQDFVFLTDLDLLRFLVRYDTITSTPELPEDIYLYRGIIYKFNDIHPGDIIEDDAFMSTSTSPNVPFTFCDHPYKPWNEDFDEPEITDTKYQTKNNPVSWVIKILAKRGTKCHALTDGSDYSGECEVLLPRKSKLKVISVDKEKQLISCELQ